MPRIAVDAMGGDFAPTETVRGVSAVSLDSDIQVVLVGDADQIRAALDREEHDPDSIAVRHCSSAVGMDEEPHQAI